MTDEQYCKLKHAVNAQEASIDLINGVCDAMQTGLTDRQLMNIFNYMIRDKNGLSNIAMTRDDVLNMSEVTPTHEDVRSLGINMSLTSDMWK